MDRKQITEYLEKILSLEVKKYEISGIIDGFYDSIYELEGIVQKKKFLEEKEYKGSLFWSIIYAAFFGILALIISFVLLHLLQGPTEGSIRFCIVIAIVVFAIALFSIVIDERHAVNNSKMQNKNIKETNLKIENNAKRAAEEIRVIENEISTLEKGEQLIENTLKRLYDANIIFPKYRTLVAVSSFYEYFLSGRCDKLSGHEGAYNIYENELMGRVIIGKLDDIIDRLDEIRSNQFVLYTELQRSNKRIKELSLIAQNASHRLEDISKNQNVIAYNSEIIKRNTEVTKWISICNYLHI